MVLCRHYFGISLLFLWCFSLAFFSGVIAVHGMRSASHVPSFTTVPLTVAKGGTSSSSPSSPYIDWISAKDRPRVSGTQIIVKTAIRTLINANMAYVAGGLSNSKEREELDDSEDGDEGDEDSQPGRDA